MKQNHRVKKQSEFYYQGKPVETRLACAVAQVFDKVNPLSIGNDKEKITNEKKAKTHKVIEVRQSSKQLMALLLTPQVMNKSNFFDIVSFKLCFLHLIMTTTS